MARLPYWRLSGFYLFYFALLGATAPFLGLYFEYLGFSPARIGELVAIPMLMRCIAPNLWGWLGDVTGIAAANAVLQSRSLTPWPLLDYAKPEWPARLIEKLMHAGRRTYRKTKSKPQRR